MRRIQVLSGSAVLAAALLPLTTSAVALPADPAAEQARPRLLVDVAAPKFTVSPAQLGANNNKWYGNSQGLWDGIGANDAAEPKIESAGVGLLRYPGGTSANLFDWKRSVGPAAGRRCQTEGSDLTGKNAAADKAYGPAEHLALVRDVGAQAQIMVPFVTESPADAAAWVEYLNAPVGLDPDGDGTDWAAVRAAQGHPGPYNVTRWEIGNEQDRNGHQRYWLPADPGAALGQYIAGAERPFTDQPIGRDCDFSTGSTRSNGRAGQTFYLRYGLIKPGTAPVVEVDGSGWRRVDSFDGTTGTDQVYTLNRSDGSVTFGDGTRGKVPANGAAVTASYTLRHEGFVAMYDAMKAVAARIGTDIDVCAAWAPRTTYGGSPLGQPSFAARMKARGTPAKYDCVGAHPYTNFNADFGHGQAWQSKPQGHNWHMLGDTWATTMIRALHDDVAANSAPGPDGRKAFVTVSELGALWFGGPPDVTTVFPAYSATMTHALYMASQFIDNARWNTRWVEGNTLVAEPNSLRSVLGGSATGFVYTAEAMTREVMRPVFAANSTWIGSQVDNQEFVTVGELGRWPVLEVAATRGTDGKLRIIVVNRRMNEAQTADLAVPGFRHTGSVGRARVLSADFASYNDGVAGGGDDTVRIARDTITTGQGGFEHTFPAHSVTVFTLTPA